MNKVMLRHFTLILFSFAILLNGCTGKGGESEKKKAFRYNQAEGISSLDPAFGRSQANIWAINQLYNGLFELDNNLAAVPSLVDSWEKTPDGKTYTFRIKKGVLFHDGNEIFPEGKSREVTAQDFVYSFKRIIDPKTASTGAWIFNDKVLLNADGSISDTCFKAVDNYTLKIYLKRPFAPFLQILAMPYTNVVPKEAIEKLGKDFARKPIGTGPFKFKVWVEGNSLIFDKNEKYWRVDEVTQQKLPYLDAVQVFFIPDKNQAFGEFQKGNLDFISGIEEGSKDLILNKDGSIKKEFSDKYETKKTPYLNTEYIGFQLDSSKYSDKKHPFLDKRVRQAMNYAVNRRDLVAFLRNKLGVPGEDGIVPPVMPSFDSTKVTGYIFDLSKAQSLMKEAGFANGKGFPEVTLYTNPNHKDISEFLQTAWKQLGITVKIEQNNFAIHTEMVDNGRVNLFRGTWLGDYPDAEDYLAMFYSRNFTPIGPNKTHFKNKSFDDYFEKAQMEDDGFKRYSMYHAMDELLMVEAPVVVLYYDEVVRLSQKNIQGLEINAMNNLKLEKVSFKATDEK